MYYDELYHHGILGQRWGVRRFQNKDGTLTKLGRQIKDKAVNRLAFMDAKNNYKAPTNFGTGVYRNDYRDKYRNGSSSSTGHLYKDNKMAPRGADFDSLRDYAQYRRLANASTILNKDQDRMLSSINATNKAFNSFYDVKEKYSAPTNFGKTHADFVADHQEPYSGKNHINGNLVDRKVAMQAPTTYATKSAIAARAKNGGKWTTDFDRDLVAKSERNDSSQSTSQHIPNRITSTYNYKKAAGVISKAAQRSVSSYASKARVNAGRTFTNYMTKISEASKTIDADLWSF